MLKGERSFFRIIKERDDRSQAEEGGEEQEQRRGDTWIDVTCIVWVSRAVQSNAGIVCLG